MANLPPPSPGTHEVGGLTSIQALEIVRGCRGLNLVGCDLVEVRNITVTELTTITIEVVVVPLLPLISLSDATLIIQ